MKVLFISNKPPYPTKDGGCIAIADMLRCYLELGHRVHMVTISTQKHPFIKEAFPKDVIDAITIEHTEIDTAIKPLDALAYLFKPGSYNVARFEDNGFWEQIKNALEETVFDLIHFDSLYTLPYLAQVRKLTEAPCVYRSHNVEHKIWEQKAVQENLLQRPYITKLTKDLEKYEAEAILKPDAIIPITHEDAQFFLERGFSGIVNIHPIGVDLKPKDQTWSAPLSFCHIGAMDWEPNIQGVEWFLNKVWPTTRALHPESRLHLAGKAMNKNIGRKISGVTNHGEVESAQDFLLNSEVMIVPLFSGSGLRIKIVEAMAAGRLVLTTPTGIRGIKAEHKTHVIIAESAEEFIEELSWIIDNPSEAHQIAIAGRELAIQSYERNVVYQKYGAFLEKLSANFNP